MRSRLAIAVLVFGSGCFVDAIGLPPQPVGEGGGGSEDPAGGASPGAGAPAHGGETLGGGAGGMPAECGNGTMETGEACDSGPESAGCAGCQVTPGYVCAGEPSLCAAIEPIAVGKNFDLPITDLADHYDGSIESMDCAELVMEDAGFSKIQWVTLEVAVDHGYLGDLVIKLVPPAGAPVATVLSRAAVAEPVDDYIDLAAEGSALRPGAPITFDDTASVDAELLGSTIVGGVACQDDDVCVVHSNPDAAPGNGLVDLVDESPVGTWRVCFADADDGTAGKATSARIVVLAW